MIGYEESKTAGTTQERDRRGFPQNDATLYAACLATGGNLAQRVFLDATVVVTNLDHVGCNYLVVPPPMPQVLKLQRGFPHQRHLGAPRLRDQP